MAVSRGYIKVPRELFQSWIWKSAKPFCEGAAFIDLIYRARYMPTEVVKQGRIIRLSRGETHDSQYELAEAWGWGRTQVRGFLAKLLKTNRITQRTTHGITITKVVNYDTYEFQEITTDQPDNPPPNPTDAQRQPAPLYKEKERETKGKNEITPPCSFHCASDGPPPIAEVLRGWGRVAFLPPTLEEWLAFARSIGWTQENEARLTWNYWEGQKWYRKGVFQDNWQLLCENGKILADGKAKRKPPPRIVPDALKPPYDWDYFYCLEKGLQNLNDVPTTWAKLVEDDEPLAVAIIKRARGED